MWALTSTNSGESAKPICVSSAFSCVFSSARFGFRSNVPHGHLKVATVGAAQQVKGEDQVDGGGAQAGVAHGLHRRQEVVLRN
ncbi:hypothetical protein TYRP_004201 [Tyrophagus putrescentiae]|nr:hypothetical protein TYRP_004201 [Tyrophagus putrescentiae]